MNVFDLAASLTLDTKSFSDSLTNAGKKTSSFASTLGAGLSSAAKVGAAAVTAVSTAAVSMGSSFLAATGDLAEYGDNIDKMSQKMGISAEAYQEWDAIMAHSGTSIEALKPSMKTLANAAEKGSEAFQQLGISQEEVANLSQEDLFAKVITGLQEMEEGTERTALTAQLLGKGATELGALLNTSAEDTEKMRQRVHELGGVMGDDAVKAAAAYQDSLQDMQTAITGLSRNMTSTFLPSVTKVMDGITNLFSGDTETGFQQLQEGITSFVENVSNILPQMFELGGNMISILATAIINNVPSLAQSAIDLVMQLGTLIIENLPLLVETGLEIIVMLADSIADAIPDLIPTIIDVMLTIVETLIDHIDELITAALTIIIALADALIDNLPELIDRLPEIIESIVSALTDPDMITKLIEAGIKLLTALIIDLPQIIGTLLAAVPEIIEALIKGFQDNIPELIKQGSELFESLLTKLPAFLEKMKNKGIEIVKKLIKGLNSLGTRMRKIFSDAWDSVLKLFPDFGKVGNDIVKGLWNGINDMSDWLAKKIQGFGDDILSGIKDFFGIHSPSTVMRDIIGKNLVLGLSEGVEDNEDTALSSAESLSKNLEKAFENSYNIDTAVNGITSSITPISDSIQTVSSAADISRIMSTATPQTQSANMTIILELDKQQFAKAVYKYNNSETQRIGVKLAKGV